jgi:PAS domain S-box-containing protein
MDKDRNLLLAALAIQTGVIDPEQFTEACRICWERPDESLKEVLTQRGWVQPEESSMLDVLLKRRLHEHAEDAKAALRQLPDRVRRSLTALEGLDSGSTVAGSPPEDAFGRPNVANVAPALGTRYDFTLVHATGGIGRVWRAHDRELEREVAVKELQPEKAGNSKLAERFVREARLTGQLEHPGIVPVYELSSRADTHEPFYTMRFVRGRALTSAIKAYHGRRLAGQADPLEFVGLLTAFAAVCNTVAYAHSQRVLHRDLKGDNVMLGDFGEVIVLDWGLAKRTDQPDDDAIDNSAASPDEMQDAGLTVQGEIIGTPAYMAPEQAEGRLDQIDQRTDIYGLGAMLYEILTGQPPFVGSNTLEVVHKAIRGNPVPPRELCPEVPPALEDLCLKALARDPAQRYARAEELAQEIQRWQEFERRRAEDALRASEEQYHSLADFIPGVVWTACADGSIDFANRFWSDFTGMTLEQSLGSGWTAALHPDDVDKVSRLWNTALETGELVEMDYRLRRADGVYRHFLARGKSLRSRQGQVLKWFGVLTELEHSES